MKKRPLNVIILFIISVLFITLAISCKKDNDDTETITDIDGNVYNTVTIGSQIWFRENLKTTKYDDNTLIPLVTENSAWDALTTLAYCWYNNDIDNKSTYGALYNWYAVSRSTNGNKNICPSGWHVPTDDEWKQLEITLGMSQDDANNTGNRGTIEGGILKEAGTTHWSDPNTGGTNERGFSALPGGYRHSLGNFYVIGLNGTWWSSTEVAECCSWGRGLAYNESSIDRHDYNKTAGFSVRCLKDKE